MSNLQFASNLLQDEREVREPTGARPMLAHFSWAWRSNGHFRGQIGRIDRKAGEIKRFSALAGGAARGICRYSKAVHGNIDTATSFV